MRITAFLFVFLSMFSTHLCPLSRSEPSNDNLSSILNTMLSGNADFPQRFRSNPPVLMDDPDIAMIISRKHLNAVLAAYLKTPIMLGSKSGNNKNSIRADKLFVRTDSRRNVLLVFITGGILHLEESYGGVGGDLKVKQAEFELAPVCKKGPTGQVMLETRVRCVGLDLDQTTQVIDVGIAHLLQNLYLDKQAIRDVNLSELISPLNESGGTGNVNLRLAQASVRMQEQGIEIRTRWQVR